MDASIGWLRGQLIPLLEVEKPRSKAPFWVELCPDKRCGHILTPCAYECDLFEKSLCWCNQMKMKSSMMKVGFNPEWPVSLWEGKTETQTHTQGECHVTTEANLEQWFINDESTNQGTPRISGNRKLKERPRTHSPLEPSERGYLDDTWFWTGFQNHEGKMCLFFFLFKF